jgi:anaerobic selenocysteine-containing dehydrogenase
VLNFSVILEPERTKKFTQLSKIWKISDILGHSSAEQTSQILAFVNLPTNVKVFMCNVRNCFIEKHDSIITRYLFLKRQLCVIVQTHLRAEIH